MPASLKHILTGCKVSLTQGCYTWCHNQVQDQESCLPQTASNPLRTTTFVHERAKITRSGSTPMEQGQLHLVHSTNWKMLVDIEQQLELERLLQMSFCIISSTGQIVPDILAAVATVPKFAPCSQRLPKSNTFPLFNFPYILLKFLL